MLARHQPQRRSITATSGGANVSYHGGPVILGGINVVAIYWSSQTIYSGGPAPGTSGSGSGDNSLVGFFISHLGGSPYYNINSGYAFENVSNSIQFYPVINSVAYAKYWASNTNVPASGSNVSLAAIENQIISGFNGGVLTFDANAIYVVFSDVGVNLDGLFPNNCGEHGHFIWNGHDVRYAVMPHDIDSDCSSLGGGSPNNDPAADAEVNILAHEIEEANTDPDVPDQPAWYDDGSGDEIGDLCAWNFGPTYRSSNNSVANVNLGGKDFYIQQDWLAYTGPCAQVGPLRSWISGMNDVVFDWPQSCWWTATSGSAGPLSYAWYRSGTLVGSSNFYSTSYIYQPFYLVLNVTDSRGGSSWDTMYVAIDTDQNDTWNRCNGPIE